MKKKKLRLLLKDTIQCLILTYALAFLLSFLFINISFFNPFVKLFKDFSFLDVYYAEQFNDNNTVEKDIVIINIENHNRFEISQLLEKVITANPKVIGVDVIFKEQKDAFPDSLLAAVLKNSKVVQGFVIENDTAVYNHPIFKTSNQGFVTLNFNEEESVIRDFVGVYEFNGKQQLSFASQISKQFLGEEKWKKRERKLKKGDVPIRFKGDYTSFFNYDFEEFMETSETNFIQNKIVLLGYLGSPTGNVYDVADKFFTPLNKVTTGKSIPDMYGVTLHANIVAMLNGNTFMYQISNIWLLIIAVVCNFLLIMYFIHLDKRDKLGARTKSKVVVFIFSIVILWLSLKLFSSSIILKVLPIIAITVFSASVIKYYKYLIHYIQSKRNWDSYI